MNSLHNFVIQALKTFKDSLWLNFIALVTQKLFCNEKIAIEEIFYKMDKKFFFKSKIALLFDSLMSNNMEASIFSALLFKYKYID